MSSIAEQRRPSGDRLFAWLLTLLYAFVVLSTIWVHEPWRDEAQIWLIGRDAGLREMFALLPYQGHPALWYLMVRPLARMGLPYVSMRLLHAGVAILSSFLVLRFAPLPKLTRALFIFSYWMFWMFAIESRVYAIGILILFVVACLYPNRHKRPGLYGLLIGLLFNTNLHMGFVAGALALTFAWETWAARAWDRGHFAAVALVVTAVGALLWQFNFLHPPSDNMWGGRYLWLNRPVLSFIFGSLGKAFFVVGQTNFCLVPLAMVVLGLLFYALISCHPPFFILALNSAGLMLMICTTTPNFHHYGLIVVGCIFTLWIASHHPEIRRPAWLPDYAARRRLACGALNFSLIGSLYAGWNNHWMDRGHEFSGSRKMADFILQKGLTRYPMAAHRYVNLSSIAPYFPGKKIYDAGRDEWVTYARQDLLHRFAEQRPYKEMLINLSQQVPANEPFLLLTDKPLQDIPPGYSSLYKVDEVMSVSSETFYLYSRDVGSTASNAPVLIH